MDKSLEAELAALDSQGRPDLEEETEKLAGSEPSTEPIGKLTSNFEPVNLEATLDPANISPTKRLE